MPGNKTAPEALEDETLDAISGGPNRPTHDHIGNFNVKDDGSTSTVKKTPAKAGIMASNGGGNSGI